MKFMEPARLALERFAPKLEEILKAAPLDELERRGSPAIDAFRRCGGPSALIPTALGGKGATPIEALRLQRALGALAPSLSIAATMHNFSVATFVEYNLWEDSGREFLVGVAEHQLLVASGFAEGRKGASILDTTLIARPADGGFIVRGSKKPCSLSKSMDMLTAGVRVLLPGGDRRGIALIPSDSPGLSVKEFWGSRILAGAESDEVVLDDVFVSEDHLITVEDDAPIGPVEIGGLCWFELLMVASYLGMASRLAERALDAGAGTPADRAELGIELEGAAMLLEGAARILEAHRFDDDALPEILYARFSVQGSLERASQRAAELLGGMSFVRSDEVGYMLAAVRAVAFHPPSRLAARPALADHLSGRSTTPV